MTAVKHTPGPWRVEPTLRQAVLGASGEPVALPCSGTTVSAPINARLISAAPELLSALKDARIALRFYSEWMTDHCPEGNGSTTYPFGRDAEAAARAAIAKAEGGAK